jgi:DNA polymerase-3 subunit gamma/tau
MVRRLLGTADEDLVAGLATATLRHDVPRSLELLDQCMGQGVEFGELVDQLVEYWRDLMLLKATGADAPRLNFAPRFHEAMRGQLDVLSLDGILAGLDLLAATKARLRDARHARVLVEMLLVRLGRLEHLMQVATLARELDGRLASLGAAPPAAPARAEAPATFQALKKNSRVVEPPPPALESAEPAAIPLQEAHLDELWRKLLAEVGTTMVGRRIVSNLQHVESLAISGPNCLVIRLPSPYTREKQACEDPDRLGRLEAALQRLTGRAVAIRFELVDSPARALPAAGPEEPRGRRQRRDAWQEPLVRRAMETLGASLIRLDEGFGATSARADQEANADDVQGT